MSPGEAFGGLESRVRGLRVAAGLSQQQLAERTGITRQAISAIESGAYAPNTAIALRLAQVLRCRVEDLFSLPESPFEQALEIVGRTGDLRLETLDACPQRLAVARVRGRWVGHPLGGEREIQEGFATADALMVTPDRPDGSSSAERPMGDVEQGYKRAGSGTQRAMIQLLVPTERLGRTALLLGCDPSLGILCAHLARQNAEARLLWLGASSRAALRAVANGEAHVAGSHLRDPASGEYNVPQARAVLGQTGGLVVGFARWELGFVVLVGNPHGLRRVADLARAGVRLVNREEGSGSRALLDELLLESDVPPDVIAGYERTVTSHLAVARAVASGGADVGIALRATAHACALDFVPLAEVRFDLVIPNDHVEHPAVALLLDVLQSRGLRAELGALPGYDVSQLGTVIARVPAGGAGGGPSAG